MTRNANLIATGILAASLLATSTALAGSHAESRHGWFGGLDLGLGGTHLEYEKNGHDFESDDDTGAGLGVRLGYAFSPVFTLAIEARGAGQDDDGYEYNTASTSLLMTFYPGRGGFFLRTGVGSAHVETEIPANADPLREQAIDKHAPVFAFGLGYEWMVSRNVALGLALEARGGEIDDFDQVEDITFGESTLGVTMNWFF